MVTFQPDKILKMIQDLCSKHRGEMHAIYLDWEIIEYYNPRYGEKIQQPVPLVVIDWK